MSDRLTLKSSLWCLAALTVGVQASPAWAMEDPATGRWLTRDPDGYADGMNEYQVDGSNPLGQVDPYGTCPHVLLWCSGGCCMYVGCGHHLECDPLAVQSGGPITPTSGPTSQASAQSTASQPTSQPTTAPSTQPARRTDKQCCDDLPSKDWRTDVGVLICCDGRKVSCARIPSTLPPAFTNPDSRCEDLVRSCIRAHEDTHKDDVNCGPGSGTPMRPPFVDQSAGNISRQECVGFCAEARCYRSILANNPPANCIATIQAWLNDLMNNQIPGKCGTYVPPGGC